ncbi:Nrap protein [Elsinoe ampelina]|uniref:U3 small nucleolar RNA-associated protein 22 n=1 Tax=Elsinoe ampelina TaxID=302913 RepID=A0A6A6G3A9_9PEZI|nr:Nrap protein [Elsinoe ampelina]
MTPDTKRRKLEHVSDDDEDASSFASFASVEAPDLAVTGNGENAASDISDEDIADVDEIDAGTISDEEKTSEDDSPELNGAGHGDGEDLAPAREKAPVPPPQKPPASAKSTKPVNGRVPASALTGGSIKVNVLKMQTEQLLEKTRPVRNSRAEAAEKALHDLKAIMEKLSSRGPSLILEAEKELIKRWRVAIPFPEPRPTQDAKLKPKFEKASAINVVGSYVSNVNLRSNKTTEIDMMVQMSDELFQPKDYQDHRYFYRRSYYLAWLAVGIRDSSESRYSIEFKNHHGNPLRPILVVRPSGDVSDSLSRWQINILPCISSKVFTDAKLLPSKSLVRLDDKAPQVEVGPTSLYNSSIQVDRQMTAYLKLIHSASSTCEDFKDAALLLRIWLKQRGFSSSIQSGGFGNFEVTALLAALISSGSLSPRYSTYQLFKATLQYLATKDALKSVVILGQTALRPESVPEVPLLFDGPRAHNLLFKMSTWSYKSLRAEARNTISMLGDNSSDQFDATFLLKQDTQHLKYDISLTLANSHLLDQRKDDYLTLMVYQRMYKILAQGLGDRAVEINLRSDPDGSWDLGSARPAWMTKGETTISIRLNPTNAGRTVDHGPSAEQKKEAAEFRKFWGEKAELRRFKDGSIMESLVWTPRNSDQDLVLDIINVIVSRHFGDSIAAALQQKGGNISKLIPHTGGLLAFQPAMDALKQLEDDVRSLEGLPLTIRQISAADEQARFASVHPPSATDPIDVVLQFESSTRWPNSLTAVQRTKAAFLLLISRLLTESNSNLHCRVGLENSEVQVLNQAFLEIQYPTIIFRLRLHHDLELSFLQSQLKSLSLTPPQRESTALALAAYKRTFINSPSHTSYITKLSTIHPTLSPTIRLLKQWFSSHHLTNHFPAPLIELLALQPFLHPHPHPIPSSPKTGFLRVLSFLSRWDWRTTPLLLPLSSPSSSSPSPSLTTSPTRFQAWRKLDPSLNRVVLFVAYECDAEGTAWTDVTQGGPGRVVAGRMTALARAAMEEVEKRDMDPGRLFSSGEGDFGFVLCLDVGVLGGGEGREGKKRKGKGGFKNLELPTREEGLEGFDPVEGYLGELQAVYGSAVVFFYGGKGSDKICGLWNPVTEKRGWKVGLGWSSMPVKEEGDVVVGLNKEAVLGEMARLGGELVKRVEVGGT